MTNTLKWDTLGNNLFHAVLENERKPKEEKKTNKELFREFADKYDTTEGSTSFHYYTHIKPKLESKNIDDSIQDFLQKTSLTTEKKNYKIGDVADVTITSVVDFGAFGVTDDGVEGLIHISQITGKEYVTLPDDYFFVGERVKVKIAKIDKNGKYGFSTRALGGKERANHSFAKLENAIAKDTISAKYNDEVPNKVELKIEKPEIKQVEKKEVRVGMVKIPIVSESEKDHVIQFVKNYSGNNVSTKAIKEIEGLLTQYPVFKITLALVEAIRDLDISSFIVELTKERLSGERLRRSTEREDITNQAFLRKVE